MMQTAARSNEQLERLTDRGGGFLPDIALREQSQSFCALKDPREPSLPCQLRRDLEERVLSLERRVAFQLPQLLLVGHACGVPIRRRLRDGVAPIQFLLDPEAGLAEHRVGHIGRHEQELVRAERASSPQLLARERSGQQDRVREDGAPDHPSGSHP